MQSCFLCPSQLIFRSVQIDVSQRGWRPFATSQLCNPSFILLNNQPRTVFQVVLSTQITALSKYSGFFFCKIFLSSCGCTSKTVPKLGVLRWKPCFSVTGNWCQTHGDTVANNGPSFLLEFFSSFCTLPLEFASHFLCLQDPVHKIFGFILLFSAAYNRQ